MIGLSTGLRMAIVSNYGLGAMMNGGIIRIYDGMRPISPDMPPSGTELARVTTNGAVWHPDTDPNNAGLIVQVVAPGALMNAGAWRMKGITTGVATWFRWCWSATDPEHESVFYPRIDGDVDVVDGEADLVLLSTNITPTIDWEIDSFLFVLPMGDA